MLGSRNYAASQTGRKKKFITNSSKKDPLLLLLLCVLCNKLLAGRRLYFSTTAYWMDGWWAGMMGKSASLFALCFFTSGNWWFSTAWATIKRASCQKNANNQSININQRCVPGQARVGNCCRRGGVGWGGVVFDLTLTTGLGLEGNWYLSPAAQEPQTQFGSR